MKNSKTLAIDWAADPVKTEEFIGDPVPSLIHAENVVSVYVKTPCAKAYFWLKFKRCKVFVYEDALRA